MEPKFNIDRPKVSDEEINKHKDFEKLVDEFKKQSIKQAQGDESWRGKKMIRYTAVITGITVICTVTLISLLRTKKETKHETLTTSTPHNRTSATSKKPFINAPSRPLAIPYSQYKIDAGKGGSITHSLSPSRIQVPASSFVTREGKAVKGEVTIDYREFHDAADIIVSGIPMNYDSAGRPYHLESAGMFDIRGSQNGEPVFIRPDKKLEVSLASANNEDRFNQYYLDTVAGNWQCLRKDKALPVTVAKTRPNAGPHQSEAALVDQSPSLRSLDHEIKVVLPRKMDSTKLSYTRRIEQLPRSRAPYKPAPYTPGRPSFKLDGSYKEFPELSAFNNVVFEVGPENRSVSKDIYEVTWSDVKISQGPVKGRNYWLRLNYRDRSEQLIVYPVLTGTDLQKAEQDYSAHLEEYETLVEKRKASEKRLQDELEAKQAAYLAEQQKKKEQYDREKAAMLAKYNMAEQQDLVSSFNVLGNPAKASRLFSISQFGIFNSDCAHARQSDKTFYTSFIANGQPLQADFIYLVDHSTRQVFEITRKQLPEGQNGFPISYQPDNTYSICVFSGRQLYTCGKEAFKAAAGGRQIAVDQIQAADVPELRKALEI